MATRRLIDADAYIEEYQVAADMAREIGGEDMNILADFYCEVIKEIKKRPTVDAVEVVHGRWVWHDGCFHCTNCKATEDHITNYCPYCGAKMDGDGNG